MRAVKLRIVTPQETTPVKPRVNWRAALREIGIIVPWLLWTLWEMVKLALVVVGVIVGMFLMMTGVFAHFIGGPPRWQD